MAGIVKEDMRMRLDYSERQRIVLKRLLSQRSLEDDTTLWSLADLMTLLLIFFILFYSHAVSHVVSNSDAGENKSPVTVSQQTEQPESLSNTTTAKIQTPSVSAAMSEDPEKDETLEILGREVLETLNYDNVDDISVHWDQRRLVLVLGEKISFSVGEADLMEDFQPTLRRISGFIGQKEGYKVVVAGHTDDTPINSERYPSNWELSAARAVNVAKFLIENGVSPLRISIEGYAEYSPLIDNSSLTNRQLNRRVEVTLVKEKEGAA